MHIWIKETAAYGSNIFNHGLFQDLTLRVASVTPVPQVGAAAILHYRLKPFGNATFGMCSNVHVIFYENQALVKEVEVGRHKHTQRHAA
jgi:hypothetical protein